MSVVRCLLVGGGEHLLCVAAVCFCRLLSLLVVVVCLFACVIVLFACLRFCLLACLFVGHDNDLTADFPLIGWAGDGR